jgi:hypothetical protein
MWPFSKHRRAPTPPIVYPPYPINPVPVPQPVIDVPVMIPTIPTEVSRLSQDSRHQINQALLKLEALELAGVETWVGYPAALERYYEMLNAHQYKEQV